MLYDPNDLIEALKRPNEVAPEVPWSVLMAKAAAEIERLQSRIQRLEGHLDWVGWDSEGVEKAKAEIERLQAGLKRESEAHRLTAGLVAALKKEQTNAIRSR